MFFLHNKNNNTIICLLQMALIFLGDCKMVHLDLMPVAQYVLMLLVSPYDDWTNLFLLTIIHGFSGWWVSFTALIATHHNPIAFHMGDDPMPNRDWGLQQLDSVRDVSGKNESLFLVATTFGDHLLHHLFPSVDHSKLGLLYPALEVHI